MQYKYSIHNAVYSYEYNNTTLISRHSVYTVLCTVRKDTAGTIKYYQ